ncbi:hypothetical protein C1H46_014193 [Malus baccata]|uniref:F-box domain-containing protein n=1 Tax=Malus baccata TaxID=106549 RepID=A0A540MN09_MALBA|nr:hypothetical protein C1H46_014193 [Malus baccata]
MSIDDLPVSLLAEILFQLPCESVTRFKSVSKRWLALISDPSFVKLTRGTLFFQSEFQHETENFTMSVEHSGVKSRSFSSSFVPCYQEPIKTDDGGPVVVGTHNDLVLYCATRCQQREYDICNPHTKRWVGLPPAPQCQFAFVEVGFLCDTDYNKKEDDKRKHSSSIFNAYEYRYVVVRILHTLPCSTRKFEVEIFSSETGEWRKSVVSYSSGIKGYGASVFCGHSIAYNGMLYWAGYIGVVARMDPFNKNSTTSIGVGDITVDKFLFTAFDKRVDDHISTEHYRLGVWQGRLRMCHVFVPLVPRCPTKLILSIWELKEEEETAADGGEKWCLIERVSTDQMVSEDPPITKWLNSWKDWYVNVLGLDPNNEEIVYLHMLQLIVICNIRTRTLKIARRGAAPPWIECFPFELPCWPTPLTNLP